MERMVQPYEHVKAKTAQEAIDRSKYQVGQAVRVVELRALANNDGTWTVVPIIGVEECPEQNT